jgi:hypothetical protein
MPDAQSALNYHDDWRVRRPHSDGRTLSEAQCPVGGQFEEGGPLCTILKGGPKAAPLPADLD